MSAGPRILIVGAGIGGLTAALGLLRAGFDVQVFEQSAALREVGAGLTISSGGMRCLDFVGVLDDVEPLIARPRATPFLHYRTGEVLAEGGDDEPPVTRDRHAPGHVYRADFHALLVDRIRRLRSDAIVLDHRLEGIEQDSHLVRARFVGGATCEGDALIGCDGVRSVVRNSLFGDDDPTFSGKIAYRFLLPYADARPHLGALGDATAQYVGVGKVFIRYPISNQRLLNCVGLARSNRWMAEGWSQPATTDELLEEFDGWHQDVRALMTMAPPDHLIKWGIFERPARSSWTVKRATVLGDAAHPMPPFMGLGATTAIEDGTILVRAFTESGGDVELALQRYERARVPRANRALEASKLQGAIFDQVDPAAYPPPGAPAHDPSYQHFDPMEVALT
jgi:salicylate hydroxylase